MNPRPPEPHSGALPGCATSRLSTPPYPSPVARDQPTVASLKTPSASKVTANSPHRVGSAHSCGLRLPPSLKRVRVANLPCPPPPLPETYPAVASRKTPSGFEITAYTRHRVGSRARLRRTACGFRPALPLPVPRLAYGLRPAACGQSLELSLQVRLLLALLQHPNILPTACCGNVHVPRRRFPPRARVPHLPKGEGDTG